MVTLIEKGSADQVKAKAQDALAFARTQQWADQEVAVTMLLAGAFLKEKRFDEAIQAYRSARQAALRTVHKTFQDAFSESKLSVGTNYAANLNSNDPIQSIWRQPLDLFNGVTAVSIPNYGYGDFDSSAICGGQLGCRWFIGDDVKDSSPPPGLRH